MQSNVNPKQHNRVPQSTENILPIFYHPVKPPCLLSFFHAWEIKQKNPKQVKIII